MEICVAIVLSSTVLLRVPGPLTLSWEHSVEHFRVEEDYRATADGALILTEVRTGGAGAGIDIPRDARLVDGVWRFTPPLSPLARVQLANSNFVRGYRLCWREQCVPLNALPGAADQPLVVAACQGMGVVPSARGSVSEAQGRVLRPTTN
ncbi:MAG TPA: DUF1850 domain-containing protein [Burkholderiaceae bacterium]|nr:DUF1850 domain-containing protein [Burkholderiaceae bacterium]